MKFSEMSIQQLQEQLRSAQEANDFGKVGNVKAELAARLGGIAANERRTQLLNAINPGVDDRRTSTLHHDSEFETELRAYALGETRALSTGTGTAGGFLVPEDFMDDMMVVADDFGGVRSAPVRKVQTQDGRDLPWPNLDDTGAVGELLAENAPATEDDPAFGSVTLKAELWSSKLVKVPRTLIEDTAIPVADLLAEAFGIRIGRAQASFLFDGTGTNEPEGISVGVPVGHTTAAGQLTTLIYDDFVELEHSVPRAYRSRGHYLLSDDALKAARKIKDADGNPIWSSGLRDSSPATINGYGYTVVDELPDLAAAAKPIMFGWLGGYVIRDVVPFEFIRLDELFAQARQVGFLAWARSDARHVNPVASGAVKSLQMAAA